MLMQAMVVAGHEVDLVSRFRSWEGNGHAVRQNRLRRVGERLRDRIIRRYERVSPSLRPDVWFTYHLYHKAPDWLGPAICRVLNIPYVLAEASHASKQANGRWQEGFHSSTQALGQASAVIALNRNDIEGVKPLVAPDALLVHLKPFQEVIAAPSPAFRTSAREKLASQWLDDPSAVWLLAVGMMRAGAKLASYQLLANVLQRLGDCNWRLIVVGDGACRRQVEEAFQPISERVYFAGAREPDELSLFHGASDLFLWPAINEAYGMAMLEAQSAGLPVVAGGGGGVADIVRDAVTGILVAEGDVEAFTQAARCLIEDGEQRRSLGKAAAAIMSSEHDVATAGRLLGQVLQQVREQ